MFNLMLAAKPVL